MKFFYFILLVGVSSYSQTNRYSSGTVSKYTPATTSNIDIYREYYKAQAEQRIENIKNNILFYEENANYNLNTDDYDLRQSMFEVKSYVKLLGDTNSMSLEQAEWYVKKMGKIYNKAVRKYNKALKKKSKN